MIGSTCICHPLRITCVTKVGIVTEKESTVESESDPLACEALPDWVLITLMRFASIFVSLFLSLILEQSNFQYPNSLLAQRPITLVLMMINSCSYSTNDLVFI